MKTVWLTILSCCLTLFLVTPGSAQVKAEKQYKLEDPIPMDPSVRVGRLPNGLFYFLQKNNKPENRAELRLAVKAGSLQEGEDQQGLAHFVEHMAFNGSENFDKNELVDYLESVGVRFGPDLNAYTSFDETVYMVQARTDSAELLQKGMLILQDWAGGVAFDPEEIDKERGVVISEWRSRLSPEQRMQQEYFPIMYKDSRYAERLPIGKPDIIENADYATIKRFYEDWYRPNLMGVMVVGDFDLNMMEQQVIKRFSNLTNPDQSKERKKYTVPFHKETLYSIVSDEEAPFTQVQVHYKHQHVPVKTVKDYKRSIAQTMYNRMLNARLYELQQSAEPPFTFAYSGYGKDVGDLDTYDISAFTAEGQALKGLEAVLTETKRVKDHGFTETELERQKQELLRAAEKLYKEKDKTESSSLASRLVYHFLNDNSIPDAGQRLALYKQLLPTITLEDINPLAKKWITNENRVVVVTGPKKEEVALPTEAELDALLNKIDAASLEAYVDKVDDSPLLEEKLESVAIKDRKEFEDLGVTEVTLVNGVTVVMKPTNFKNDEIRMSAFSPGGHSLYPDEDYPTASSTAAVIDGGGLGKFPATELQKKLSGKVVSVGPYIGELSEGVRGSCSPEDLETLFQLTYLQFTAPRKDEAALASFVSRQKSILQNIMVNPYYFFSDASSRIKYNNHPRRGITKIEELEAISLDRAMEIYQDRFADASDFTFVFVGNFEVPELLKYVQTYLGNLPGTNREESWKDIGADLVVGKIDSTIVRGQAPKALVDITYHGNFEYTGPNRYNFYSMRDLVRIKLREAMREDKGGVYGVRVGANAIQDPKTRYTINISFNSEPDRVQELIETAMAEIEKLKTEGVEEKDLQKIKETQRQGRIKNLKENGYWMGQLLTRYQQGMDLEGIKLEVYEKYIDGLTMEDLQQTVKQYFGGENKIQLLLMPEEGEENR